MNKSISREERQRMVDEAHRNYLVQLIEAGEDDVANGRTISADDTLWDGLKRKLIAKHGG